MGCVDAQHGAGVEAPENVDQLVVHDVSIDLTGGEGRGKCTSWNAISLARTARKARAPGRKETVMAASGVCPLLVRPMVFRIRGKELRWARVKSVRLETYRAELLEIDISHLTYLMHS